MATFGSYGNLGGELVNVVELGVSISNTGATTHYTVPLNRYALIIIRSFSIVGASSFIRFEYGLGGTFAYTQKSRSYNLEGSLSFLDTSPLQDETLNVNVEPRILTSSEAITTNSAFGGAVDFNFLIFEYRKP